MIPLKDENPTSRRAYITLALILANVIIFVFVQQRGDPQEELRFTYEYAAIPCELVQGHPLTGQQIDVTLGTGNTEACDVNDGVGPQVFPDKQVYLSALFSMFLHGSWFHLGFNMLFLWIFGNNIEDHMGPVRYLAFYLLGGAAATAAHVAANTASTVPVIGASGAVAAVMGAYLVWFPNAPVRTLFFFILIWIHDVRAKWLLGAWFVIQFFTGNDSGVAWVAHVGGFVFGVVVALMVRASRAARDLAFEQRYRSVGKWDDTGGAGDGPYPGWSRNISDPPDDRRFGGRDW